MPALRRWWVLLLAAAACLIAAAGAMLYLLMPERQYDPSFDTRIAQPAYPQGGPVVLFDNAHLNTHAPDSGYRPFLELLRSDGYAVRILQDPVTPQRLAGAGVFVVVCPRGRNDANDEPAFTASEIDAIDAWVRAGGALLLVTDHWPYGPAARSLAARFGVDMAGGFVQDPQNFEQALEDSHLVFSRDNRLLGDHPITRGRSETERINRLLSFTGQSIAGPADATVLLALADTAQDSPPTTPVVEREGGDVRVSMEYGSPTSASGRAQGLALEVGEGRVVVLGEAGMLRAHKDRRGFPVGMNYPGYDNRQFALNVMHWLSGAL